MVCAGSDNGASPWACPHIKEIYTTHKHCLSWLPLFWVWHGELVLAQTKKKEGNLQPPYLSCIRVRAFLTQVLAVMPWSSLWALWYKKVFWDKQLLKTQNKNTEKAGHGQVIQNLLLIDQYFPLIWDSDGSQCLFITSAGLECHQWLFISAMHLMQLQAVALAAWQCKTKRDSVWSHVLFSCLWPDLFCYPCAATLFVRVGQRWARVHQEWLRKPQWKWEDQQGPGVPTRRKEIVSMWMALYWLPAGAGSSCGYFRLYLRSALSVWENNADLISFDKLLSETTCHNPDFLFGARLAFNKLVLFCGNRVYVQKLWSNSFDALF